jgi:hypothetical protein
LDVQGKQHIADQEHGADEPFAVVQLCDAALDTLASSDASLPLTWPRRPIQGTPHWQVVQMGGGQEVVELLQEQYLREAGGCQMVEEVAGLQELLVFLRQHHQWERGDVEGLE